MLGFILNFNVSERESRGTEREREKDYANIIKIFTPRES